MGTIYDNLKQVRAQIAASCTDCGRNPHEVTLLAVSKTFGSDAVRAAYAAGQRAFGENYVQEGIEKIAQLNDLPDIVWHMIGPVQSNKTRVVAEQFAWVHSIDRLKIAERLSQQRPAHLAPLQVCIQVNMDGGANKSGVPPEGAAALAAQVAALPRLQLRGIMVIPEPTTNSIAAYDLLTRTTALFNALKRMNPGLDTLSMGMSADMQLAVSAGSTMLRVGTAIFGSRPPPSAQ
ncbi:MAG: YggS family pyridoxal phosphate-dependent enzyme [Burkholderiaceae bacterium]